MKLDPCNRCRRMLPEEYLNFQLLGQSGFCADCAQDFRDFMDTPATIIYERAR